MKGSGKATSTSSSKRRASSSASAQGNRPNRISFNLDNEVVLSAEEMRAKADDIAFNAYIWSEHGAPSTFDDDGLPVVLFESFPRNRLEAIETAKAMYRISLNQEDGHGPLIASAYYKEALRILDECGGQETTDAYLLVLHRYSRALRHIKSNTFNSLAYDVSKRFIRLCEKTEAASSTACKDHLEHHRTLIKSFDDSGYSDETCGSKRIVSNFNAEYASEPPKEETDEEYTGLLSTFDTDPSHVAHLIKTAEFISKVPAGPKFGETVQRAAEEAFFERYYASAAMLFQAAMNHYKAHEGTLSPKYLQCLAALADSYLRTDRIHSAEVHNKELMKWALKASNSFMVDESKDLIAKIVDKRNLLNEVKYLRKNNLDDSSHVKYYQTKYLPPPSMKNIPPKYSKLSSSDTHVHSNSAAAYGLASPLVIFLVVLAIGVVVYFVWRAWKSRYQKTPSRPGKASAVKVVSQSAEPDDIPVDSPSQSNKYPCSNPKCPNRDHKDLKTKKCTCTKVRYCSRECQKANWPVHKAECSLVVARTLTLDATDFDIDS